MNNGSNNNRSEDSGDERPSDMIKRLEDTRWEYAESKVEGTLKKKANVNNVENNSPPRKVLDTFTGYYNASSPEEVQDIIKNGLPSSKDKGISFSLLPGKYAIGVQIESTSKLRHQGFKSDEAFYKKSEIPFYQYYILLRMNDKEVADKNSFRDKNYEYEGYLFREMEGDKPEHKRNKPDMGLINTDNYISVEGKKLSEIYGEPQFVVNIASKKKSLKTIDRPDEYIPECIIERDIALDQISYLSPSCINLLEEMYEAKEVYSSNPLIERFCKELLAKNQPNPLNVSNTPNNDNTKFIVGLEGVDLEFPDIKTKIAPMKEEVNELDNNKKLPQVPSTQGFSK